MNGIEFGHPDKMPSGLPDHGVKTQMLEFLPLRPALATGSPTDMAECSHCAGRRKAVSLQDSFEGFADLLKLGSVRTIGLREWYAG